jgi:import inner membrane translocase subunit TIM13
MLCVQDYEAQTMQDIYNQISAKCFAKCIGKPGDRLDKEEQKCLAKCVDRYIDSREVGYTAFVAFACW